jgi:hypothetical protein
LAGLNQVVDAKNLEVNNLLNEKTLALNEIALVNSTLIDKSKRIQALESKIADIIHEH